MSRRRGAKSPPFIMLPKWLVATRAWRSLDGNSRALYLELRGRFNGHNNGTIGLGNREAGFAINVGKDTARRCFDALMERGFVVVTSESTFHQKRLSREWCLTELPDDRTGHKATKDFVTYAAVERKNIGASALNIGASKRQETAKLGHIGRDRRISAPVLTEIVPSQAHGRATSISTITPERKNGTQ